jgi:uncharacterized membrane protein (DUF485 family)
MARDIEHDAGPAGTGGTGETGETAAGVLGQDPELESELGELQRRHRGFVFPATLFAFVFYMALIFAAAYAHDFMARKVWGEINVAYLFALSEFVMTFVLAWLYTRFARRTFDPMASALLDKLRRREGATTTSEGGRA